MTDEFSEFGFELTREPMAFFEFEDGVFDETPGDV